MCGLGGASPTVAAQSATAAARSSATDGLGAGICRPDHNRRIELSTALPPRLLWLCVVVEVWSHTGPSGWQSEEKPPSGTTSNGALTNTVGVRALRSIVLASVVPLF